MQEAMDETAGNATRGRGEDAWRLEPEGETETPENRVVSDGVEGVCVDLDGEGHHERGQVKNASRHSDAPGGEGEEIKRPKRRIIRVEPEETQDCVRKAKDTDQEEAEKLSFVPSAISVPRKPTFRCDILWSEKTLSFWQLASVLIKEGEESYTTNLCQKCCNVSLKTTGEKPTDKLAVEAVCGETGAPWKALENDGKRTTRARDVGIFLPRKR